MVPSSLLKTHAIKSSMMTTTDPILHIKFPIGPFKAPETISHEELNVLIKTVEDAPAKYRSIGESLQPEDLVKTYRDGSWNAQHAHVGDE